MTNLINTDNAGNVFYNYITPVTKGVASSTPFLDSFFATKLGASGIKWFRSSNNYLVLLPAPGLETKTANVGTTTGRVRFAFNGADTRLRFINSRAIDSSVPFSIGSLSSPQPGGGLLGSNPFAFAVINDYALCYVAFSNSSLTNLIGFLYLGWLREPVYTGGSAIRGVVAISGDSTTQYGISPRFADDTTGELLSTAADSITSPPIVCTPATAPGVGTATFTDVVVRDAAAPNNPVGKLWNCIDMPASCNVGELWKNTGAYDADGSTSNQDVYLCVMPWGTRKLGMRVWTENVS